MDVVVCGCGCVWMWWCVDVVGGQENVKYAVRMRNRGQRTRNGDAGLARVSCADGTTFNFTACSLSSNGNDHCLLRDDPAVSHRQTDRHDTMRDAILTCNQRLT